MASIGVGIPVEIIDDIVQDIDTFTQEFRWTSNLSGNFNYVAGIYYLDEETDRTEQFRLLLPGPGDIGNEVSRQFNETTSYAGYFQGDYDFSDALTLTVGLRYTYDDKETRSISVNCGQPGAENYPQYCTGVGGSLAIIAQTFDVTADDSWSDVSPKVTLTYRPQDNMMVYGTVAYGFKSGGFGGAPGTPEQAQVPVDPEDAINYELGLKGDFLDQSLRVNAAAFYIDYQDLQIVRFGPTEANPDFGSFITDNIGEADIYGIETEFTWYPSDNFRLSGNYAYLSTEVNDLIIAGAGGAVDVSGSDLRQAPENKYSLTASYDIPLSGGALVNLRADYAHTDEQINDYLNQDTIIEEFDLFDARVAWVSASQNWTVAAWGKNLTDEEYISHSYVIGPGVIGVWGHPRTYGLSVSYEL